MRGPYRQRVATADRGKRNLALWSVWESEGLIVPAKPSNVGGGKGSWFWYAFEGKGDRAMTKSLVPEKIERLQRKLYDKAKQEPNFRFYTLYDKVCRLDSLQYAYALAKANRGAPGVDGIRFEEIEAQGVERWLGELKDELVKETYRPKPVKRVMIPKPGGGERPLGIPTIRDRVVQTAAVLYLAPIFEADFEDNLHGYRPGRSAHDALKEVQKRLWDRTTHVVDADVSKYFDSIPHADLLKSVARRVSDGKMLRLIKLWLKSPVVVGVGTKGPTITGGKKCKQGVPQGGVISPLLANIYMNRFVRHWQTTGASTRLGVIINYADDFVIMCKSRGQAVASLAQAGRWLEKVGLITQSRKDPSMLCLERTI